MRKDEREHLAKVVSLSCVVCRNEGLGDSPACAHHIRHGQGMAQRSSHHETIPLCWRHHQGPEGIHTIGTREWQRRYGIEAALLAQVREELGIT